jgi:Na+/proline symporter
MTSQAGLSIALGGLYAAVLTIGFWCALHTRSTDDFHLAGRSLGAVRAALSQAAGAYGSWILIGVSAAAYTLGLAAAWFGAGILSGAAITWFYVGPAVHRQARAAGVLTAFELLGNPSGTEASRSVPQSAAGIAAVAVFFGICAQFSIAGGAVARVLGVPHASAVLIVAGATLLAALLGGLRSISAIGVLCALVIAVVALVLPVAPLLILDDLQGLWSLLARTGHFALDPFGGLVGAQAILFVLGAFGIGIGLSGQPQLLDQFIATRSERHVRWAGVIALAWLALVLLGTLLTGWCARALYESIDRGDAVIFEIAQRVLPPAVLALPVIAIVAAVVACLGAQLVVVCDALILLTSRATARSTTTLPLRTTMALAGGAATAIAALAHIDRSRVALLCWLATGAVLGPLFLVRASGAQVRPGHAAAAMRIGIVLTLLICLLPGARTEWLAAVFPISVAFTVAALGRQHK